MTFLEIRTPTPVSIIIIILGLLIGGFLLLMGVANLINPEVSDAYMAQNTRICLIICVIGIIPLLMAIAAFRGILHKKNHSKEEHQT